MFITSYKNIYLFRTPFSSKYDLVQKFIGSFKNLAAYNNPINFLEAGLVDLRSDDEWHSDIPLSIMTDEPPPCYINNDILGANHDFPHAVSVYVTNHGRDYGDIGSIWRDGKDTEWTLIAVDKDTLTFISENIGKSINEYAFKSDITPPLKCIDGDKEGDVFSAFEDSWRSSMAPIIKHTECVTYACYNDGTKKVASRSVNCDFAEIIEKYDIVNPVSMVEAIRKKSRIQRFTSPITNAMGDTMVSVSLIYRIEADGTVMIDFSYERKADIKFISCRGAMFQPKLDVYKGGVHRYIPKSLPFETPEGHFDFTSMVDLSYDKPFPKYHPLTVEYWENPDNPPDRIVDYFKDKNGKDSLAFACGYLPVFDGVPSVRKRLLNIAVSIIGTKKAYPVFMGKTELTKVHGIAYKKYFTPESDGKSFYEICFLGKKYYFFDLFKTNTFSKKTGEVSLIEKSEDISYTLTDGTLTVKGDKGYAVFVSM